MIKKMAMLILIVGMLINAGGCKEEKTETLKEIKARVQAEIVKPNHDKLGAFTIAQDFIKSRLKCPRTAKWPWISYTKVTVYLGSGRYQISSYLDAQNGFGALVRIYFICVVEHISGDRWRLINLTF